MVAAAGTGCVLCGVRKVMGVWPERLTVRSLLTRSGVVAPSKGCLLMASCGACQYMVCSARMVWSGDCD